MTRSRMALVLVPVPEGVSLPGEVQVGGQQTLESILGYPQVPRMEVAPSQVSPSPGPRSFPTAEVDEAAPIGRTADLRRLKRAVARLPKRHPLKLSLDGEPDSLPRAELLLKLREWVKFFAWEER